MDEQRFKYRHCPRSFESPRDLRSHIREHKKKQSSCGDGSIVTSFSSSASNPNVCGVPVMETMALVDPYRPLPIINSLSPNYNEPEDPSSSSSNPKDDSRALTKVATTTMVIEKPQPLQLQWAVGPSSSHPHHNEAEDCHRCSLRLRQGVQERRIDYVCVDCDRSFSSHYALGGHRSSKHSRKRLQHQPLLLSPLPPPNNNNNNQVGSLPHRSQRLRLLGVNIDVVPEQSS